MRTPVLILPVKDQILRTWGGGKNGKILRTSFYGWPRSDRSYLTLSKNQPFLPLPLALLSQPKNHYLGQCNPNFTIFLKSLSSIGMDDKQITECRFPLISEILLCCSLFFIFILFQLGFIVQFLFPLVYTSLSPTSVKSDFSFSVVDSSS